MREAVMVVSSVYVESRVCCRDPWIPSVEDSRGAALAGSALDCHSVVDGLLAALDWAGAPVALCNRDGRVQLMTNKTRVLLQRADGLGLRHGRLVADLSRHGFRLSSLLREVGSAPCAGDPTEWRALRVRRPSGAPDYELLIAGLPGSATSPARAIPRRAPSPHDDGLVIVLFHDPLCVLPDARLLAALYDFTPMEAKVASLLSQGLSTTQIRERIGVGRETVKSHLHRLYAKTGARRQSALVSRLLSGLGRCSATCAG